MTGIEVVGLVFGTLPLLISAAEHYEDVFRPFKRYRKFAPELESYQQQLGTQKTIFRNECHLLLATLTDGQTARHMLKERKHPLWLDPDMDEQFAHQLGDSGDSCRTIIASIQDRLRIVGTEAESFGLVIQQSIPLGSIGDKAWRSRVGKKLKFSLSQLRLDESLESLRKSNQDFRTLAAQTSKLEEVLRQPSQDSPFSRYSSQKIEDCRLVQKASTQLYQALERACQSHENHSAHFRLESEHVSKEESGFPLVRFNIAFTHGGSSARLEPAWIAVDSTFDDLGTESLTGEGVSIHEAQIGINELSNHLKHELKHDLQPIIKRIKTKSVRFAETSQYTTMTARPTVVASFLAHPALPDFCVQHDLCHQLQRHNSPRTGSKYLGYLHKSGPWKHLVHFAPPIASYMTQQPVTLTQIVSSISQKVEADQFLQYERLRLARQLASAVLQFHATPLLRNSWRSEDVVFFNSISSTKSLTSPHLNVQVGKLNTPGSNVLPENPNARGNESNQFIRNPYLFSLGVILIELACQAPLNSLREDCDLVDGQASKYTDYFVANRVSRSMGSSLGVNYAKVVRKCLGCDFGEGTTELKDPGLQAVFYKDVVCELERLERAFAMLQLGT